MRPSLKTTLSVMALISLSTSGWATCTKSVDKSKVMFFVDTNQSELEIATAQKAACARGERLEVVPKNYKHYSDLIKAKDQAIAARKKCMDETTCKKDSDLVRAAQGKYQDFIEKQPPFKEQISKRLEELNKEKVKLTNFTISGHDGGGEFGGDKGNFRRQELVELIGKYPEMNKVQSILLLGCYTGVQHEVAAWKAMFPKVRIIAGYDKAAPLSQRPYGHSYIADILTKEKSLIAIKNDKKVDQEARKLITDLEKINAGIYLKPSCSSEANEFYYGSHGYRKFDHLKLKECDTLLAQLSLLEPDIQKYSSGELEPPKNTVTGDLRKIYDKIRSAEHCLADSNLEMNANDTFNLLFWDGVKKNFADFYKDDLIQAAEILKTIDFDEVKKRLTKEIEVTELSKAELETELKLLTTDPEGLKAKEAAEIVEYKARIDKIEDAPEYKVLLQKWTMGQYDTFTQPEKDLVDSTRKTRLDLRNKEGYLQSLTTNLETLKNSYKDSVDAISARLTEQQLLLTSMSSKSKFTKFFVPDRATVETKTRKEILTNIHNISGMLSMGGLTDQQNAALSWLSEASSGHLQYFENPFGWHEATGKPAKPQNVYSLEQFLENIEKK